MNLAYYGLIWEIQDFVWQEYEKKSRPRQHSIKGMG